jgi:glycine/D-amino acid oxidase-like deaminating enzyme
LVKIGATHRRNCPQCKENPKETAELLNKAAEIVQLEGEVVEVKGGFRAGTRDFFPVVGPILDWEETLRLNPKIVKGEPLRTPISYPDLYIINGMGGRGFSNAVLTARLLLDHISKGTSILDRLHPARLLIKYARRLERTG